MTKNRIEGIFYDKIQKILPNIESSSPFSRKQTNSDTKASGNKYVLSCNLCMSQQILSLFLHKRVNKSFI